MVYLPLMMSVFPMHATYTPSGNIHRKTHFLIFLRRYIQLRKMIFQFRVQREKFRFGLGGRFVGRDGNVQFGRFCEQRFAVELPKLVV